MKGTNKLFLYSLTSLAVMSASAVQAEQLVTAPTLEGGFTAMIGAWYNAPSADGQDYGTITSENSNITSVLEVDPDYDWGLDASLGYIFQDTANGVELNYRWHNSDDSDSSASQDGDIYAPAFDRYFYEAQSSLSYEVSALDLMFNQFLDIGRSVQVRLGVGASYLNLEKEQNTTYFSETYDEDLNRSAAESSDFSGIGPRVNLDGRYDFGNGFGILGGGSIAYYVGDLDYSNDFVHNETTDFYEYGVEDDRDNHAITNLRANVAVDYVFFMEEASVIGLELGYQVDYYADAIQTVEADASDDFVNLYDSDTHSLSFTGPYLNLKGAF